MLHARLMAAEAASEAAAVSACRRRGPQPHRRRELLLLLPGTDGDDVEGEDGKARSHEINRNASISCYVIRFAPHQDNLEF